MISSDDQLRSIAAAPGRKVNPGFGLVIAFAYYDGPEEGLALFESGHGLRFSSLGDSPSRLFRAFELVPLDGNWWERVRELPELAKTRPDRRVLVPSASEALDQLRRSVVAAQRVESPYVAVGPPGLDWLGLSAISAEGLSAVRELDDYAKRYRAVNQLVKATVAKKHTASPRSG